MISGFNHITLDTTKVPSDVLASITANKKPTVVEYLGSVFLLTFDGTNWSGHNSKIDGNDFIIGQSGGEGDSPASFARLPEDIQGQILSGANEIPGVYTAFAEIADSGKPALVSLPVSIFDGEYQPAINPVDFGWYVMNVTSRMDGVSRVIGLSTVGLSGAGAPIFETSTVSLYVSNSAPNYLNVSSQ